MPRLFVVVAVMVVAEMEALPTTSQNRIVMTPWFELVAPVVSDPPVAIEVLP
jgi:hypothetical protein